MWIKGNYRRNLMDMHIDDWNPEFLSKINVKEYVEALKDYKGNLLLVGINYDKKTKEHQCVIEKWKL